MDELLVLTEVLAVVADRVLDSDLRSAVVEVTTTTTSFEVVNTLLDPAGEPAA